MNTVKIITLPDARLRQKSNKILASDPDTVQSISNMTDLALEWERTRAHEISAAIAAVQIGELKRLVIVRSDFNDKSVRDFTTLINPEIVKYEGEIVEDYEGCLSVKDIYGKVPRYSKIRVKALDVNGNEIRFKAEGFLARVIQHEIDHTNGIVFIDHIKNNRNAFYKLDDKGELEPLSYGEKIEKNHILWD